MFSRTDIMIKTTGCLLTVFILVCTAACHAQDPVIIASNDYEPYTSSENNGSGVILDIVKQVFDEIHLKMVFKFYPWKRCEANTD